MTATNTGAMECDDKSRSLFALDNTSKICIVPVAVDKRKKGSESEKIALGLSRHTCRCAQQRKVTFEQNRLIFDDKNMNDCVFTGVCSHWSDQGRQPTYCPKSEFRFEATLPDRNYLTRYSVCCRACFPQGESVFHLYCSYCDEILTGRIAAPGGKIADHVVTIRHVLKEARSQNKCLEREEVITMEEYLKSQEYIAKLELWASMTRIKKNSEEKLEFDNILQSMHVILRDVRLRSVKPRDDKDHEWWKSSWNDGSAYSGFPPLFQQSERGIVTGPQPVCDLRRACALPVLAQPPSTFSFSQLLHAPDILQWNRQYSPQMEIESAAHTRNFLSAPAFGCPAQRNYSLDDREADLCKREAAVRATQERLRICHEAIHMWELGVQRREKELEERQARLLDGLAASEKARGDCSDGRASPTLRLSEQSRSKWQGGSSEPDADDDMDSDGSSPQESTAGKEWCGEGGKETARARSSIATVYGDALSTNAFVAHGLLGSLDTASFAAFRDAVANSSCVPSQSCAGQSLSAGIAPSCWAPLAPSPVRVRARYASAGSGRPDAGAASTPMAPPAGSRVAGGLSRSADVAGRSRAEELSARGSQRSGHGAAPDSARSRSPGPHQPAHSSGRSQEWSLSKTEQDRKSSLSDTAAPGAGRPSDFSPPATLSGKPWSSCFGPLPLPETHAAGSGCFLQGTDDAASTAGSQGRSRIYTHELRGPAACAPALGDGGNGWRRIRQRQEGPEAEIVGGSCSYGWRPSAQGPGVDATEARASSAAASTGQGCRSGPALAVASLARPPGLGEVGRPPASGSASHLDSATDCRPKDASSTKLACSTLCADSGVNDDADASALDMSAADGCFHEEDALLGRALGGHSVVLHHVGSTAVANALCRPYLDILLTFAAPAELDGASLPRLAACVILPRILEAGYVEADGEQGVFFKSLPPSRGPLKGVLLYVREATHPSVARFLAFRDRLRADAGLVDEYNGLKMMLAQGPTSVEDYVLAKRDFIARHDSPICG